MSNEDIIKYLLDNEIDGGRARYGGYSYEQELLGEIEEEEIEGGEGQGDHAHTVIYLPKFNLYLRSDGWYSSGYGFGDDWGKWRVVTPQERTITVYE